mmetsp:Transcript_37399/g.105547  ORF Transcript_37399/g.105547 Transcript_37399/m.105547 type:complete len:455 (+) Transcript_37399:953-2317(+)
MERRQDDNCSAAEPQMLTSATPRRRTSEGAMLAGDLLYHRNCTSPPDSIHRNPFRSAGMRVPLFLCCFCAINAALCVAIVTFSRSSAYGIAYLAGNSRCAVVTGGNHGTSPLALWANIFFNCRVVQQPADVRLQNAAQSTATLAVGGGNVSIGGVEQKPYFVTELYRRWKQAITDYEASASGFLQLAGSSSHQVSLNDNGSSTALEWRSSSEHADVSDISGSAGSANSRSPRPDAGDTTRRQLTPSDGLATNCETDLVRRLVEQLTPMEFRHSQNYWPKNRQQQQPLLTNHIEVAYILYVFDANTVHGAERLVHWLYTKKDTFVFHVEANSSDLYLCYLQTKFGHLPNVVFAPRSVAAWGSWGIVQAELDALQMASQIGRRWRFAITLCGSTAALWPLHRLQKLLTEELTIRHPLPSAASSRTNNASGTSHGVTRLSMIHTEEFDAVRIPTACD